MQKDARYLTDRDILIIDDVEIHIVDIDKTAVLTNSAPVIAVFIDASSDKALLLRPYQLVSVKD